MQQGKAWNRGMRMRRGKGAASRSRSWSARFELLEGKLLLAGDAASSLADPDGVCPDEEPEVAAVVAPAVPEVRGYAPSRRLSLGSATPAETQALTAVVSDLALEAFTIDGPNVRVDYSVVGDDFIGTRVQLYKRDTFSTLLYESEVLSGEIGNHSLAVAASSLQGIEPGDKFFARVMGVPASGVATNPTNDRLDFEFTTDTHQTVNSDDDSGADELVREKHTLRELLEVDAAFGWYELIDFAYEEHGRFLIYLGDHTGDGVSDPLVVADDIVIDGPGYVGLYLFGNDETNIFQVAKGSTVKLEGMLLRNGYTTTNGGAIYSEGNLTLEYLYIFNSTAEGLGGGVYSNGPSLNMDLATVGGCSAASGGGLFIEPEDSSNTRVHIERSTLNENTAIAGSNDGGVGGALWIAGGAELEATILNSTISGNSAVKGAGLALFGSSKVDIVHATITSNTAAANGSASNDDVTGGGIHHEGSDVTIHNSIVAGNFSSVGIWQDIYGVVGSNSGHNMLRRWEDEEAVGGLVDGINGNIVLSPQTELGLAPLNSYGGANETHLLRWNSPAVDAADDTITLAYGMTTDQMGFPRFVDSPVANNPAGNRADIGSYESD